MRRTMLFLMMVGLAALGFASPALAAPGDLDTSFGTNGTVTTAISSGNDYAYDLALQSDGKMVAAGASGADGALARYKANGSLDTTFGGDGKVVTNFGPSDDVFGSLAIQPDGKIVAAGYTYVDVALLGIAVARYNQDGSPDTTFGGDGKLITRLGPNDSVASSVAVQPDGKIVVGGSYMVGTPYVYDFALVRYTPDGSLDASFDGDGKLTTDLGSNSERVNDLTIQSEGKIAVAGHSNNDFAVARYNEDGSLDTNTDADPTTHFDTDGFRTTDFGTSGYTSANALAIDPDGKMVVAGYTDDDSVGQGVPLARYDTDGSLDASFSGDGKLVAFIQDGAHDVALQLDGKILVVGSKQSDLALARFNADGARSTTFGGGDGQVTTDFTPEQHNGNSGSALALQPDGKIVAAGFGWVGTSTGSHDFALARYYGGDSTTPPGPVANFTATAPEGARTLSFTWTNPTDGEFAATRIMRTAAGRSCDPDFYNSPSDRNLTTVYEGRGTSYSTGVIPFGTYCYVAFARDDSGNWSRAVKRTAVPDNTVPVVTITSKPSSYTASTSASFGFSSDTAGSPFQCRIDGSAFQACNSPKRYTGLTQGKHTFGVRALNAAGDPGAVAGYTWMVDTTDPRGSVSINGGDASTRSRQVTLRLQAWDPVPTSGVSSMRFSNDATGWSSWKVYQNDNGDNGTSSSWTLSSGTGTKTVYVQYRDRAGNIILVKDTIKYAP